MEKYDIITVDVESINKTMNNIEKSKIHTSINDDLNNLSKIVIELQELKYGESFVSKLPIIGNIFSTIKKETLEKKYDNTKSLVLGLKNEISQKIQHLKQDDLLIEPLIKTLSESVEKNLETIKVMKTDLKSFGRSKDNSQKRLSLVNKIKNAEFLVKAQVIQTENLKSMKEQNVTLINDIETNLNTLIIAISTSTLIAQQLYTRDKLLETEKSLRNISNNMLYNITKEVSEQGIKYQDMILHKNDDDSKISAAIDVIKQTREQYKNFNNNVLPSVIDKITEQQNKIELLYKALNDINQKQITSDQDSSKDNVIEM